MLAPIAGTDARILAPHPVLTRQYGRAADRQRYVARLFDSSARHYDRINTALSLGMGTRYRRQALRRAGIAPGMRVLDVGTGTGVIAREAMDLVGQPGHVTAVDPSRPMLAAACRRGVTDVRVGAAEALPCDDREYDMVTMGYTLRHVNDLNALSRELFRVLQPDGVLLVLEQTPPRSVLLYLLFRLYMKTVAPRVTRVITGSRDATALMSYYWDTLDQCVPAATILEVLTAGGFTAVRRALVMSWFSEYTARRPAAVPGRPAPAAGSP